jgi:hypothetical protein
MLTIGVSAAAAVAALSFAVWVAFVEADREGAVRDFPRTG